MSAANPNPQYNSPAEQAFVEMGSTAFKDIRPDSNRFQEIDAQYAGKSLVDMVNPDPEKNSNSENKNLFQRILVAAYAQRFVDSVKSMLNTHENGLPSKGNESYEQYACKCLSKCGVTWSFGNNSGNLRSPSNPRILSSTGTKSNLLSPLITPLKRSRSNATS